MKKTKWLKDSDYEKHRHEPDTDYASLFLRGQPDIS